jgi:hypothetical protein
VDFTEIRMRRGIEPVGEKTLDMVAAELPRRQADGMQDYEADVDARGALVLVRGTNDSHR